AIPVPAAAQEHGISIIHQEMNLMPDLTVAQNIFIGREPRRGLMLDEAALNRKAAALLRDLGIDLDVRRKVADLTVAAQQMVEIERLADRVTVLRDGRYIGTLERGEIDIPTIIEMMVGRSIDTSSKPDPLDITGRDVVLRVSGLTTRTMLEDVGFKLHRGEILGFAGLMGAGRTETARAIIGADRKTAGVVEVNGRQVRIRQPADAVRHGLGYLSEDRKNLGLMLEQSVTANTVAASLDQFSGLFGIMNDRRARSVSARRVDELRTRTPSVDQPVKLLSGGNQQKVVIAKWLVRDCDILIFDEP